MEVRVCSFQNNFESFNNVLMIKIKHLTYSLIIMKDYLPLIGEVQGNVTIVYENGEKNYENIRGYYKIADNKFEMVLDDIN